MELDILNGIQLFMKNPVFDAFFPVFTYLGEAGAIWVVIGMAMLGSRRLRPWGVALLALLAVVGLGGELLLKNVFARPRPFVANPDYALLVMPPSGYSFPSGHTSCAIGAAVLLSCAPLAGGWKAGAWVLALLLAFSRLYLYVHYPTDVLAGAIVGTIGALVAVALLRSYFRARGRRQARSA